MTHFGTLYVIAAPSGTGKTTLVKSLVDTLDQLDVSISHTTRPKRPAEIEGIHYYFIDEPSFQSLIAKEAFLEHATVFNHLYGTSREHVELTLRQGIDVILEIDWQGCQQIKKLFSNCISIFILPPSLKILQERLMLRNQDKPDIVAKRLADAEETLSHLIEYDYIVVNDDFQTAFNELKYIILANRLRREHQLYKLSELLTAFPK